MFYLFLFYSALGILKLYVLISSLYISITPKLLILYTENNSPNL